MTIQEKLLSHAYFPARFREDSALPDKLAAIAACLIEGNARFNLTAITEPDAIVEKHLIDSLIAADKIAGMVGGAPLRLLDVGSGAGFPSLPIAAALPDLSVTALDSTAKKCTYMNETAAKANIPHFTAVSGRAEELAAPGAPMRASFDLVTARAVANLPVLCELCLPFLKTGGTFIALKGSNAPAEIDAAKGAIKKLGAVLVGCEEYHILSDDAPRYLVTIAKTGDTPRAYPRHYAQISKNPL